VLKLNVGCGSRKIHGFVNLDARSDVNPDAVCDVSSVSKSYSNVDLIYACHVLEHFSKKQSSHSTLTWNDILKDWYSALREGGILRISVPDFKKVCDHYRENKNLDAIMCLIYGGQNYDFDFHFHAWDFETLKRDLKSVGFREVRAYDWRNTEHHYVDDYSQSYLPHMDKLNGMPMSLNVEAVK